MNFAESTLLKDIKLRYVRHLREGGVRTAVRADLPAVVQSGFVKSERGEEEPMSKEGSDRMSGSVMIVGGGIAGMQAALDLADSGYLVKLVEKSSAIGGVMSELDKTFPTNDCAM